MIYPLTEIVKPGPITKGTDENNALLGTDLELIDDRSEASKEIPSAVDVGALVPEIGAGASGSVGAVLYMISYDHLVRKAIRSLHNLPHKTLRD